MKKVLLAFDGSNFSDGAFEFVRRLNLVQPVLVAGVFLPQVDFANLWSYASAVGAEGAVFVPLVEEEDAQAITKNISHFESLCQANQIAYRVHKDFYDLALPELKKESRFADLVILSAETFYKRFLQSDQYDYLKDATHAAECPVLIVPENYEFPDNNILAYDGSAESVFAIRQFAYIFPELAANKTLLVYAEEDKDHDFPSKDYMIEYATQHFKDLTFYKLEVNPKKYFNAWIAEKKSSILVSGSFGRSTFSEIFKKSFVADIIREHKLPVFIAHK